MNVEVRDCASHNRKGESAGEESDASTDRSREVMKGNVTHVKQVRNLNRGGQNTVVQIKPLMGNPTIVDLGPTQPLLNLALAK